MAEVHAIMIAINTVMVGVIIVAKKDEFTLIYLYHGDIL